MWRRVSVACALLGPRAALCLSDDERKFPFVILGAGYAGRAALAALPRESVLIIDQEKQALEGLQNAMVARATWLDPGASKIGLDDGTVLEFTERCVVALGAPRPHVPPEFVDPAVSHRVVCLGGRGRLHDQRLIAEISEYSRGHRVAIIGGSWPAVSLASRCPGCVLVVPEHGPLAARVPRWLSTTLKRRLEKRCEVRNLCQVAFVGRSAGRLKLYLARSYDALSTSNLEVDLVVVAGEYHFQQSRQHSSALVEPGLDDRCARCAPPGAASLPQKRISLEDLAAPLFVNDELCASSRVLAAGDAAATPARLAASTLATVPVAEGSRLRSATSLASHAGVGHAVATGEAAGAHAASRDGSSAAYLLAQHVPLYVIDDDFLKAAFLGRCDAELEAHSFYGASGHSATLYLDRPRPNEPKDIVGVLVWGSTDVQKALQVLLKSHMPARDAAEFILQQPPARHRTALSRAERLGPTLSQCAADAALFSRGRKTSLAQQLTDAYSAGIKHGLGDCKSDLN